MGVPALIRRQRMRNAAGQASAFRDSRIAQEQSKVDKERSERLARGPKLKSWEKRGEESYKDRDARLEREAQEARDVS